MWGLTLGMCVLAAATFTPLGPVLLANLERAGAAQTQLPPQVTGLILLGGFYEPDQATGLAFPDANGAADRLLKFVALARQYPEARLYFTGGEGALNPTGISEADMLPATLRALGFTGFDRLTIEGRSRNTAENAALTKAIAQPKAGENWLLVTSAWHMPRAKLAFEQQKWPVIPAPADFRAMNLPAYGMRLSALERLQLTHIAMREYLGLLAYKIFKPSTRQN